MNVEIINNTIELRELIGSLMPLVTYTEFDDWVDKNLKKFWSLIEGDIVDFYYLLESPNAPPPAPHYYSIPTLTMHISLSRKGSLDMKKYLPGTGWIIIDKCHSPWVFFSRVSNALNACARQDIESRIFTRGQLDVEYCSNFGDILVNCLKYFIGEL